MTVFQIAERLAAAGIDPDCVREEARLLVMRFTGVSRTRLLAEPAADYDAPALAEAVEKRAGRYPLQYLLGEWSFMGLPFSVDGSCLIPRPDTEVIAEAAIRAMPKGGVLLDLCTGSGCIAASVLHYTEGTRGFAVELDPETARTAVRNLTALGLADRCGVIVGDADSELFPPEVRFDVITANPPYIAEDEMPSLAPELAFEPRHALTDGGDGLSLLNAILSRYRNRLAPGGSMILEHGWRQADAVRSFAEALGYRCTALTDYGGNPRGALLSL